MADNVKGDGIQVPATKILNKSANNTPSTMEVDPPSTESTENSTTDQKDEARTQRSEPCDKDDFDVEEDDDANENSTKMSESEATSEPMDGVRSSPEVKVKQENAPAGSLLVNAAKKGTVGEGNGGVKIGDDDEVLLVNPLFGKPDITPPPPVIDIESSSSSDDDNNSEEDFAVDVTVNNFQQQQQVVGNTTNTNVDLTEGDGGSSVVEPPTNGQGCGYDCYQEKGILVNEIERLRKAVYELNERHSLVEDFIEVEYADRFEKFLKNREHLVSMGFGGKESEGSIDVIDGKRSSKSGELIELLRMIKEQTDANVKEETPSIGTTSSQISGSSVRGGGGSGNSSGNKNNQQKTKPIPSISSGRDGDRRGSGRGGAHNYNSQPIIVPNIVGGAHAQQFFAQAQMQAMAAAAQQRYYGHDNMYGSRVAGGWDSRDHISVVGRTDLYPPSSVSSYGYPSNRSDGSRESKKQRKRKRQSEVSSSSNTAKSPQQAGGVSSSSLKKKGADTEDIEVIDYTNTTQALNTNAKRICPLCQKIVNRKALREHLSIVHQGHKVACPVCQVEFMQRRRIKTHMRDAHDLPTSEYSTYIEKIYKDIEEQCGPWLDKLMLEAEPPTKDQLLVHNAEIQLSLLNRREQAATAETAGGVASVESSRGASGGGTSTTIRAPPPPPSLSSRSAPSSRTHASSSSSFSDGAGKRNRDQNRGSNNTRVGSSSQPVRYFTGANTRVSPKSQQGREREAPSAELYGPGGYAQYAAKYLQQRSSTGSSGGGSSNRLYTPF